MWILSLFSYRCHRSVERSLSDGLDTCGPIHSPGCGCGLLPFLVLSCCGFIFVNKNKLPRWGRRDQLELVLDENEWVAWTFIALHAKDVSKCFVLFGYFFWQDFLGLFFNPSLQSLFQPLQRVLLNVSETVTAF